jgi:hypothetical protein
MPNKSVGLEFVLASIPLTTRFGIYILKTNLWDRTNFKYRQP